MSPPSTSTSTSPPRARRLLGAAGYPQVAVVHADAEHGVPEFAPYDRILVTAGAWDIPRPGISSWVRPAGDRTVVTCPAPGSAAGMAPLEVSIRGTGPVRAALAAAPTPIAFPALVTAVRDRCSGIGEERVAALIGDLLAAGVLVSDLRPPLTVIDPLSHLRARPCGDHLLRHPVADQLDPPRRDALADLVHGAGLDQLDALTPHLPRLSERLHHAEQVLHVALDRQAGPAPKNGTW